MSNYDYRINYMGKYYYEELERNFLLFTENKNDLDKNKNYNVYEIKKYFSKHRNTAEFGWLTGYMEVINKFQYSFNFYNRVYLFIKMIIYMLFSLYLKILGKNKGFYSGWICAYLEGVKLLKSPFL